MFAVTQGLRQGVDQRVQRCRLSAFSQTLRQVAHRAGKAFLLVGIALLRLTNRFSQQVGNAGGVLVGHTGDAVGYGRQAVVHSARHCGDWRKWSLFQALVQ